MCGICGLVTKKKISGECFDRMVDALEHRGPDDRGVWSTTSTEWSVRMGHRRLSIIDCSANGHQPMIDETGRYIIIFNGEIYNHVELKRDLKDFSFISTSDTEVLLYLYIKYGPHCVDKINGMYALAVYDKAENSFFLARDRMGKKPLYYYLCEDSFVFASELKSFLYYPFFKKTINKDVMTQYFSQNCILPPNTIYENTYKLKAGEYLIWKDGHIEKNIYYSPISSYFNAKGYMLENYDECKNILKDLLYDSVEKRLLADVSVGTFLSGGIDSTLITAIANDIRSDRRIDTFTIGFAEKKYDESRYARNTAKFLGVNHHEMIMSENDLLFMLEDLTTYYDEPFSDASQLPTMLVSKFARENVTVILSGDGGDELFAGYSNIDTLSTLSKYDPLLSPVRKIIPQKLVKGLNNDKLKILLEEKKEQEKLQYYAKMRENIANSILYKNGKGTVDNISIANEDWRKQRMLLDMTTYLPDENLTKVDRGSMRFSLEARCPLLDYRIVDFSMKIPFQYKYNNGVKKYILKDILYDYVPKEMMERSKMGFSIPIYKWLRTALNSELKQYFEKDFVENQGLFKYDSLIKFLSDFTRKEQISSTQIMWSYFVFQRWYKQYLV